MIPQLIFLIFTLLSLFVIILHRITRYLHLCLYSLIILNYYFSTTFPFDYLLLVHNYILYHLFYYTYYTLYIQLILGFQHVWITINK